MSLDRVRPHTFDAEVTVLASLLVDEEGEAIHEVVIELCPDDFYKEAHKLIFAAMMQLHSSGQPITLVSVAQELRKMEKLEAVGGNTYLASLTQSSVASIINITYYRDLIRNKAELRRLIDGAHEILELAYTDTEETREIIDKAENIILQVAEQRYQKSQVAASEIINDTMAGIEKMWKNKGQIQGLETGFHDLDQITNGLQPDQLIVIAARPSMGKTAFCLNLAERVAVDYKKRVLIFSLEMSSMQIMLRMISTRSKVNMQRINKGILSNKQWGEMMQAASAFRESQIWIDDDPGMSYMDIRSKCRRLKSKFKHLDLVIVDYLQLISSPPGVRIQNRTNEIGDISRNLKILSKEIHTPVIALSQLNRKIEDRQHRQPMLSDLRDSGAIEQDADVVTFLHREDYYQDKKFVAADEEEAFSQNKELQGKEAQLIIAKQRNGPVGTIKLTFFPEIMRFENFSYEKR